MGVKQLNRLFRTICVNGLKKTNLRELKNRKIAVDISIYMYKYKQQGDMIDGIFNMITLFQKYNIIPIFVFDGKPPIEKYNTLLERHNKKQTAKTEYDKLLIEYTNVNTDTNNKTNMSGSHSFKLQKKLEMYKRDMTKLSYKDIVDVKKLINFMGENYYESHIEADSIIAKLVKEKNVWGCMSEDMDMFVYGCPVVLRYFSIVKEDVVVYDLNKILLCLNLTYNEFKEICVLAGTDYNSQNIEFNIDFIMNKYIQYNNTNTHISFYEWFGEQNYVIDISRLNKISQMFNVNNVDLTKANYLKGCKNHKHMVELLINYGFVFI